MIRVDATMTHGKMLRHFDGYTVVRFNSMPFIGVIDSDGRLVLRQDPNSLTNNIFGREAAFYQIGSFFSSKNGREAEGD